VGLLNQQLTIEVVYQQPARRVVTRSGSCHLICDDYVTHKHPAAQENGSPPIAAFDIGGRLGPAKGLGVGIPVAEPIHARHAHASWLNLVERGFAMITGQALRLGSFDSVRRLEAAIMN
jgi:hypothetical protein